MTNEQILQFVLCISILVTLHELGHFIPAKLFKMKVEKFYLFFDPWFSIVKKRIGQTEYGIGWLPFGGYVKIAGMVDESMDKNQLAQAPKPWEFRSKPAWQRFIVMIGGVTVNFFLAWLIFSSLSFFNGETVFETDKMNSGISYSQTAKKMGFQDGDKILKVDGKVQKNFGKLSLDVLLSDHVSVLRGGKEVTFMTNDEGKALAIQQDKSFLMPRIEPIVDSLLSDIPRKAGLKIGDKIIEINGQKVSFFDEVQSKISSLAGKTIQLQVERNGQEIALSVPVSQKGTIDFVSNGAKQLQSFLVHKNYSFIESIGRGFTRSIESLTYQIKQFKLIFNKKVQGYKKVSGPIGIIRQMPTTFDWEFLLNFTAMFSIWLAFINLLPIPGLDGGHVIFTLWEIFTGKPVPQKVLENAQTIGVILLLGLMLLIIGNDLVKLVIG